MLNFPTDIELTAPKGTQDTSEETIYLPNFAASNRDTEILCRESDVILRVDSYGSYLVSKKSIIRAVGYYYINYNEVTLFNANIYALAIIIICHGTCRRK